MRTLLIIGCGKTKRNTAAPAKDLYTGQLFRAARRYAEARNTPWLIASAKHGLVDPDVVLEPYDQRLGGSANEYRRWGLLCQAGLAGFLVQHPDWMVLTPSGYRFLAEDVRFELLLGAEYAKPLREFTAIRDRDIEPLAGLSIGQRLQWFAHRHRELMCTA